jgi:ferredoxin
VIAAYFVALAAMPFAHHDVVCHVKSGTHCATCHVGASADQGGGRPSVVSADLADAGAADHRTSRLAVSCALSAFAGRAPPVTTASFL